MTRRVDFLEHPLSKIKTMKAIHLSRTLLSAAAVSILMAHTACSDEHNAPTDEAVQANFIPTLSGTGAEHTRAVNDKWSGNETVGIYGVKAGGSLPASAAFSTYKPDKEEAAASVNLIPTAEDQIIYYPINGSKLDFYAFSPMSATYTPNADNTVTYGASDQTTTEKMEAIDLIWTKATGNYSKTNPTVKDMVFTHRQSKIIITVTAGTLVTAADMANPKLEINDIPYAGTYNLSTGALHTGSTLSKGKIDPYLDTKNSIATKVIWEAIVPPHSGTTYDERRFVFTLNGILYTCILPKEHDLSAGKAYHLDMNFTTTGVVLKDVTITDWNADISFTIGAPSNCYMVKPDGHTIAIPVRRANEFALQIKETDLLTASILWADVNGVVKLTKADATGYKDYIYVTGGATGNALVALKNEEGTILWSWHIWVTNYDPDSENATFTNNGFTFMDRNLGAAKAGLATSTADTDRTHGLYYQWGRKDPFPSTLAPGATQPGGGTFTVSTTNSTIGTVAYSVQNPTVFLGLNSGRYDWNYNARDNELWGHSGGKTLYDPCPAGWRVPKNPGMSETTSPWYGYTKDNGGTFNKGYTWNGAIYPASGWRQHSTGVLGDVAIRIDLWSASPYSESVNTVTVLSAYSTSVEVHKANYRSTGFPVRCVRE